MCEYYPRPALLSRSDASKFCPGKAGPAAASLPCRPAPRLLPPRDIARRNDVMADPEWRPVARMDLRSIRGQPCQRACDRAKPQGRAKARIRPRVAGEGDRARKRVVEGIGRSTGSDSRKGRAPSTAQSKSAVADLDHFMGGRTLATARFGCAVPLPRFAVEDARRARGRTTGATEDV
jgi:hypothetical protein